MNRAAFGQVGYCAANDFLDAYASHKSHVDKTFTVSINWCGWRDVGMAAEARKRWAGMRGIDLASAAKGVLPLADGLSPSEGIEIFQRVLTSDFSRIAVSTRELPVARELDAEILKPAFLKDIESAAALAQQHVRPKLTNAYVSPRNPTEENLARFWQELFGIEQIGVHDNFFDLGGHSLLATQVNARILKAMSVQLSVRALFDHPTIEELATAIIRMRAAQADGNTVADVLADLESIDETAGQQMHPGKSTP
jgi:acyl carrier protein